MFAIVVAIGIIVLMYFAKRSGKSPIDYVFPPKDTAKELERLKKKLEDTDAIAGRVKEINEIKGKIKKNEETIRGK